MQPRQRRAILTAQQAVEIFRFRSASSLSMMVSSALIVVQQYGVNERTVRDIWKQRSWTHATLFLAEGAGPMARKQAGRPMGSKDVRPRKQRIVPRNTIPLDVSTFEFSNSECYQTVFVSRPPSRLNQRTSDSDQLAL